MVQKQRKEWKIAKSRYIDSPYSSSATYKMHFVTMASDASHEGLVNLKYYSFKFRILHTE